MPVEVKERYLEVRDSTTNLVITAIELLSPKNKRSEEGWESYEKKRQAILSSATHFIEVDLLRAGQPLPMFNAPATAYRILISRSNVRPAADLYSFNLQQSMPDIPIPLKPDSDEPIISLQAAFNSVYDRARYATRIDYHQPAPPPKLTDTEQAWLQHQIASKS